MAEQLKVYFYDDDTEVTEPGNLSNAVSKSLRSDVEGGDESDPVKLYAKADAGYKVKEGEAENEITLEDSGYRLEWDSEEEQWEVNESTENSPSTGKWNLAPQSGGNMGDFKGWGSSLDLSEVDAENGKYIFYAKAKADEGEDIKKDISVAIRAAAVVEVDHE